MTLISRTERRPGHIRICPFCREEIRFTTLKLWDVPEPFFYCQAGTSVLMRKSDRERVKKAMAHGGSLGDDDLYRIWLEALETAPLCPEKHEYTLWANIRCPHCNQEFPYNAGRKDIHVRLYEPTVILLDGATVVDDRPEDSWRVRVGPITGNVIDTPA